MDKYFTSREIEENIKAVTVQRDAAGNFRLYFTADQEFKPAEQDRVTVSA
jgi:hypothetical protein